MLKLTTEGASLFNRSSVSHVKHAIMKGVQSEERTACFVLLMAFPRSIEQFSCRHSTNKDGIVNKDEAKQALIHLCGTGV